MLSVSFLGLVGCASFNGFPDRSTDPNAELAALQPFLAPKVMAQYASANNNDREGLSRDGWRNEVIEARLRAEDIHFGNFEQGLYREGIGFGVGTDWAVLAVNTAGAITTGASAARTLSAVSGLITGAHASYAKTALYDRTMTVLMAQMTAHRKTVLASIRHGETLSSDQYSLWQAFGDLEDYYQAGSLPGALSQVAQQAGAEGARADVQLRGQTPVLPVAANVEAEAKVIATAVKKLTLEQQHTLAQSLGIDGPDPLATILLGVSGATTTAQLDSYMQRLHVLFGPDINP